MLKFTEDHQWLRLDGDIVTVGLTEHAVAALGAVEFIELPEVETMVSRGDDIVVIESADDAADLAAPVDGEIVEVNEDIVLTPGLVNDDPLGAGWFFKVLIDDMSIMDSFMDEDTYRDLVG